MVANCDPLARLKYSRVLPLAFTEHGAIMVAAILNAARAIEVSVEVVRAFVRLRRFLVENAALNRKIMALERRYDAQFKVVFDAIRELMAPPAPSRRRIGFRVDAPRDAR